MIQVHVLDILDSELTKISWKHVFYLGKQQRRLFTETMTSFAAGRQNEAKRLSFCLTDLTREQ